MQLTGAKGQLHIFTQGTRVAALPGPGGFVAWFCEV